MELNIKSFNDYFPLALRTAKNDKITPDMNALHAAMGVVTEVGELVDNLKRQVFYGTAENVVNFKEEIGDVTWYIALGYYYAQLIGKEFTFDEKAWPVSLDLMSRNNTPLDIVAVLGSLVKLAAIPGTYIMQGDDGIEYRETYFLEDLRRIYIKLAVS